MSLVDPIKERITTLARREFLSRAGLGLGSLALSSLIHEDSAPKPHHAPKAKRVIWLHMAGSPPQLDLFDFKPELEKHSGASLSWDESFAAAARLAASSSCLRRSSFSFFLRSRLRRFFSAALSPIVVAMMNQI